MLSKENIDKILMTGLYECEIPKDGKTWCRNWTFVVSYTDNDKFYMVDTYFRNSSIELTDENFDDFKLIFDFKKVKEVNKDYFFEYAEDKRFRIATDSGGWEYAKYYVLKDSKPLRENKRQLLIEQIKDYKRDLEYAQKELSELDSDNNYE